MRLTRLSFTITLIICLLLISIPSLTNLRAQANTTLLTLTIPPSLSDIYSDKFLSGFETLHPDIKVQVNKQTASIPDAALGLDAHFTAVQQYVTTGDVVYVTAGNIAAEDTRAGYYLDLSPLANDDRNLNSDDFYPAIWQSYQWDQGIWALPISADPFVLLYNPDAFDKAGVAYPSDQWTVDDLINAATKLTTTDKNGKTVPGIDLLPGLQGFAFRAVTKTSIIDTSVVPNTPKFATTELADLLTKWLKLDTDGDIGGEILKAPLTFGPAIWLTLKDQLAPGEKLAASMLPGGKAAISVDGYAVSGGTQHPEQAYALASWLTAQTEVENTGFSSTPARKSLKGGSTNSASAFKLDVTPEVQAIIDQSVSDAIPLSEMRFVDYVAAAYTKMKTNNLDAQSALDQAQNDAIQAQQQAADKKDKIKGTLALVTPVPAGVVSGNKVSLKFGVGGLSPALPNMDAWNKLVSDFTANDPSVGAVTVNGTTNRLEQLSASFDCFYLPYNGLAPEKLSKILALDPFITADSSFDKSNFVSGTLTQVTRDNKIYALPSDIAPGILKYDSATFSKAGVTPPDLTWTTDQFADTLKQLKTFNGDQPGFVPVNTFGDYIENLIVAYGGLPIDYRTTPSTVSFTDTATVNAIQQVTDLAKNGYFKYHNLFSGQLDLVLAAPATLIKPVSLSAYSINQLLGGKQNPDFKAALYPRGTQHSAINYNLGTLYISANTSNPDGCYRWISAVAKDPALFSSMPARTSLINDPALATAQGDDVVAVYKQIATLLQDPTTIPMPSYNAGLTITDLAAKLELYKALDKYMAPDSSVALDSVLKDADFNIKAFYGCANTIPDLDMTSTDSQKAYFTAAKACAVKADPDLAQFFAGVTTN